MKKKKIEKQIKELLKNSSTKGLKSKEISKKLKVKSDQEYSDLKQILHTLYSSGKLVKKGKRYKLAGSANEVIGTLQVTRTGNGYVIPENGEIGDIFVSEKNLGVAFNGDKVLVALFARYRGKNPEGAVLEVIKREREEFVGTLHQFKNFYFLVPDNQSIRRDIYIDSQNLKDASVGDKVVVRLLEWISPELNPFGEVIEVLGRTGEHKSEMLSIAKSFNLRTKFPAQAEEEASIFSEDTIKKEIPNRLDLRDKIIFTIDPEDAKDFDDALSIEEIDSYHWRVGVHIADVSHFVQEDSELDKEALLRGTSVYLVNHVIPMLPESLSNKWCSLVPNEDRLCYSVLITITSQGEVKDYEIKKSVINNKRRFTYEEVEKIIQSKKGDYAKEILFLNRIASNLLKKRIKAGGIDFMTDEIKFHLDENGTPLEIIKKKRLQSHRLVEDFMLLANKLVALRGKGFSDEFKSPFVYRIHDVPDEVKIKELSDFVKTLGYKLNVSGGVKSKSLQKLLDQVKGKPEEILINEVMIRTMAKAEYSDQNIGHYGLAFGSYTHFTSPIRRYPDLMVHRLLFKYENGISHREVQQYRKSLPAICKANSISERIAMEAERESVKRKQVQYMLNHIGKEFNGIISGVQAYGLFVEVDEILVEGLIHIKNLPSDIYFYDEKKYTLFGRLEGTSFRLGDKVRVKVINVNTENNEIDFVLVE